MQGRGQHLPLSERVEEVRENENGEIEAVCCARPPPSRGSRCKKQVDVTREQV